MRDTGRQKVYDAENLVFDETLYDEPLGMAGVASLADNLFIDEWWVSNINRYPEIVATRREANRSHANVGLQRIAFSLGHDSAAVLCHEAAHIAQFVLHPNGAIAAHGIEFRATMLDVATLLCGPVIAKRLESAYLGAGLEVGRRHEVEPPVRHERGIYALWRLNRQTADIGI